MIDDIDNYMGGIDNLYSGDFMSPEEYDNYVENIGNLYSGDLAGSGFDLSKITDAAGKVDWSKLLAGGASAAAGLSGLFGGSSQKQVGYQGKVPRYTAVRQQVPMANQDPARRPGSGGRQYFTNTQYLPRSDESGIAAALGKAQEQSNMIAQANLAPTQGERTTLLNAAQSVYPMYSPADPQNPMGTQTAPPAETPPADNTAPAQDETLGNPNWAAGDSGNARGGLIGLARGGMASNSYYLGGQTDGMADKIPATIANKQPAKLSHGEFVVSADVVSALGSGNSEAGAKVLYDMMDRVRKHAHGTKKQIKPANLKKTLPA
jgi:hypothetical protein